MFVTVRKAIGFGVFFGLCTATSFAAGNATAGKAVYDSKCKTCHGAEGQGNPGMAKMMKVEMKRLGGADVEGMRDEELKNTITKGKGKMKPVAVSGADLDN